MSASKKSASTPELLEVLDDLCMRFLVNLPAVEYESFERLFFAIESAHWFYDDFYRDNNPSLPRLPLKHFAARLFDHTSLLKRYRNDVDKLVAQFQSYKQEVPTCGAALLNPHMDKVLLVRGWGPTARWGFPKGKLAKDETELDAAIREVREETGFDMSPYVNDNTEYLDSLSSGRPCRIFIVTNVSEDIKFETQTRKEISDIEWVPLSALPDSPKAARLLNKQAEAEAKSSPHREKKKLFSQNGVAAFTKRLKSWISRRKKELHDTRSQSMPNIDFQFNMANGRDHVLSAMKTKDTKRLSQEKGRASPVKETNANGTQHKKKTPQRRKNAKTKANSSSENRGSCRKSRKDAALQEALRNMATFGTTGGTALSDSEKKQLFRRYVLETDRIAAEKGLKDEFWPVPYITSKDFTEEQLREAEAMHLSQMPPKNLFGDADKPETKRKRSSVINDLSNKGKPAEAFVFDRDAIRAVMKAKSPP
ncbi:mRNA decapping complex subunit 2 [Gracilariopsis chorda]|uniref:mRNA decapping complex subunit 2 n=1 Tax=Gracilariopsis chorda TaxID=448386 RepID=A0A2V3IXQ8_9FLOR|nr:mRNA decapping complex subunit 2 [Gracilariopsis chorda]|eukprot:PXF46926.1 mRNA decapping complex subunit 2 [Gracilariopsis chorda]